MERMAEGLQVLGAVAVGVGLFAWLAWPVALLTLGVLAVAGGTVLEIAARPRQVVSPAPVTAADRRAHSLDDLRRTASDR